MPEFDKLIYWKRRDNIAEIPVGPAPQGVAVKDNRPRVKAHKPLRGQDEVVTVSPIVRLQPNPDYHKPLSKKAIKKKTRRYRKAVAAGVIDES